jgi:ADP-heptose:LPS heptosyltransferase
MENWFVFPACGDFFVNSRIVERADLVVSPDTAIVHLACALKKDLIAVYRSDTGLEKNSLIWKPYGNRYKMVLAQSLNSELEADINNFDMNEMYLSH